MTSSAAASPDLVTLRIDGTVAEIAFRNGPLNLVTRAMLRALDRAAGELEARADIRCAILHGGDARAFCAGSDIKEFAHLREDASEQKILYEDRVLRRIAALPMPTIAAIDGPALGGGLELGLACDLRVLRRGVAIGLPESMLGGLAGSGAVRLARLVGPSRAKEMLYTGMTLADDVALAWGVVNRVASDGTALDEARRIAATIAQRGPLSNRLAKSIVDAAHDLPLDAVLSRATVAQQAIFDSHDLHEGADAFFAKRPPSFLGR